MYTIRRPSHSLHTTQLFLWENLVQISLMVVTVLAIKLGAAVSIMRFVNIPLSDAMTAGLSLSQVRRRNGFTTLVRTTMKESHVV